MRLILLVWICLAALAQQPPPPSSLQMAPIEKLNIPKSEEGVVNADQPQAASLSGNALFGLKDSDKRISTAQEALNKAPNDADLRLNLGRLQDSLLRFSESIDTYTEGVEKFPKDYRFLRLRGQRYLSVRKFELGLADLKKAAKMVPTSFDAAYYLGLAYYFTGDHAQAAAEFWRCEEQMKRPLKEQTNLMGGRSCEGLRDEENGRIPLQYWRYLALRRAGLQAEAKKYLDEQVNPLLTITVTKPFYEALLFFKGVKEINEMMAGANEGSRDFLTRSSGVATFLFTEGERAQACALWARNAMDQNWDHLGVINAESEYWRNSRAACALYGTPAAPK